jgi:hypothetical protein
MAPYCNGRHTEEDYSGTVAASRKVSLRRERDDRLLLQYLGLDWRIKASWREVLSVDVGRRRHVGNVPADDDLELAWLGEDGDKKIGQRP